MTVPASDIDQNPPESGLSGLKIAKCAELDVIVIHETNGRKYFEALTYLKDNGRLRSIRFVEASVIWKFAHSIIRERKTVPEALAQLAHNLWFRISCWMVSEHVILLGVSPWNFRFLLYSRLRSRNYVVYHTSWPNWNGLVPNSYGIVTRYIRNRWIQILRDRNMTIAAATRMSLESALSCIGDHQEITGSSINHVVSDAFFERRATYSLPFRILFVGELSEKKGLFDLRTAMEDLKDYPVTVEIVGDGPLRRVAIEMASRPNCSWHGHVKDRLKLAEIVGRCHVLVAPSIRMGQWEELFGISIVEAMASGLLCIASDHIGPQSIITDGYDGILVDEKSPHLISSHIIRLLHDQEMWMEMSNHAAETGRQYSLSAAAEQWEDLLAAHVTAVRASSGIGSSSGLDDEA